jgi:hypothetical protein
VKDYKCKSCEIKQGLVVALKITVFNKTLNNQIAENEIR